MFKKILQYISKHKIFSGIIIIIALAGAYYAYTSLTKTANATSYVLAAVEKGTLITSISGSGQVSASNQVDIKSKVSGDITYINIQNGQEIKSGTLLTQINAQDALKTVRDAQVNLEAAKLSLQKLQQPSDPLSLLQAQNALTQAQQTKQNNQDNLQKSYDGGFNTISNTFIDLPGVIAGLNDLLFGNDFNQGQWNIDYYTDATLVYDTKADQYRETATDTYNTARAAYDQNFSDYKTASRFSDTATIESLINETYDTTKKIAESIKNANNLIQFYKDTVSQHNIKPASLADTHLSSLGTYTGKTNSQLSGLLSAKQSIQSDKQSIINADRTIEEKTQSLAKLQSGIDPLDLQSQQLIIQQRQNALADAQQKLADYSIRAPFDGIITNAILKKGDSISAGTIVATIITKQQIAEISLNEVDAAKVKTGQKVTLSFDAIDGLSLTGQVANIDEIGTVTQGVVSYNAKISFDTQDDRIKPGMSVSASIIIEVKQDVLMVPNSAVKTNGAEYYVQTLDFAQTQLPSTAAISQGVVPSTPPKQTAVQIGISNDTYTEISSGLKEGDQIVIRTITANSAQTITASQTPSLFGGSSNRSGAGAIMR